MRVLCATGTRVSATVAQMKWGRFRPKPTVPDSPRQQRLIRLRRAQQRNQRQRAGHASPPVMRRTHRQLVVS